MGSIVLGESNHLVLNDPPASSAAPVFDTAVLAADQVLVDALLEGFGATRAALCLCDDDDNIRYANPAFRAAFFPNLQAARPVNFVDALAEAIRQGQGIKLITLSLEEFIPRVKKRRKAPPGPYNFPVDMVDGSWWWVSDYRLARGWTLVIANEMSALKQEEARLRDAHASALLAAQTDFLTGIGNRRWGFEQAEAALKAATAGDAPLTLALLDIDHFKQINDRWGHEVGDKVLVTFSAYLAGGVRRQDQVSRIGGEEFLIVFTRTPLPVAHDVLTRLLSQLPPFATGDGLRPITCTASAGLVEAGPHETLDHLIGRADRALYNAKASGRNSIVHGPD